MDIFNENDELFGGSPRKKFFDVIYNASRSLSKQEIDLLLEKLAIFEMLLGDKVENLEQVIYNMRVEKADEIKQRVNDLYIEVMGNILSNNE